jgi:predicted O-methyltransferase YrrM
MLNELYRVIDYLEYLITSDSRHGLHSPFIFRLADEIILKDERNVLFDLIEQIRKDMIKSDIKINFEDFGGGGRSGSRKLSDIASRTARESKYGRLLYRLVQAIQPEFSIELGTGTGITALYQAAALTAERPLHTIEGSAKLSEIASFNAEKCNLKENLIFHTGNFDLVLPQLLEKLPRVDYAYVDGNHRFEPTVKYYELLKAKCHNNSVLIFDDISWSQEMKQAWTYIKNQPEVTVTVDLFEYGIVFFRQEQEKEHFKIRF